MPVSDFTWSLHLHQSQHHQQTEKLFCNKRKNSDVSQNESHPCSNPKKKNLMNPTPHGDFWPAQNRNTEIHQHNTFLLPSESTPDETQEENNNVPIVNNDQEVEMSESGSCNTCSSLIHQQPTFDTYHANTSELIMNINDETYSDIQIQLGDDENICSSMESDFVPNMEQYKLSYCDNNCVGGSSSPTSGRVRCSCIKSWDGLNELRPYVSDYY